MRILFRDARLLTMESPAIARGDLVVDGGRIAALGGDLGQSGPFDRIIDCRGDLLMPTFKNAHAHTPMTFARNALPGLPLERWLEEVIFPLEKILLEEPEDLIPLAEVGMLEYLSGGIGAAFEMYYRPDILREAFERMGLRAAILIMGDDWEREDFDFSIFEKKEGLVRYRFGIHAVYTQSEERLEKAASLVRKHKLPFYLHNSETRKEVEDCLKKTGRTPTGLADSLGLFSYGGGGFHSIWLSGEDIEIYKKRGVAVISCPASNAKLADGICPLEKYLKEGLLVALGTDGPASNDALDMFREMHLAAILQKLLTGDAAAGDAYQVLKMATVNAAKVMGLADADVLAPGKRADLIRIDLRKPEMQPPGDLVSGLVYSGSRDLVRLTMVDGKILYEDGVFHVGKSPDRIYAEAAAIKEKIFRKAGLSGQGKAF